MLYRPSRGGSRPARLRKPLWQPDDQGELLSPVLQAGPAAQGRRKHGGALDSGRRHNGGLLGAIVGGLASGRCQRRRGRRGCGRHGLGGVAGNIYGKKQQRTHDQQLLAEYNRQLGAESAAMDRQTAAANVAIQCYNQAFDRLVADYKAGRITKDELKDHYAEIRSGLQETSYVLNQRYDSMVKKDAEYQRVLDTEYKEATPEQAGPVTVQTPPQVQTRRTASNWKRSVRNVKQTHDKAVKQSENNDATIASLVDQAARV